MAGILQAWGENVKATVQEFGRVLAEQHRQGDKAAAVDTPVYFDILGCYLVRLHVTCTGISVASA